MATVLNLAYLLILLLALPWLVFKAITTGKYRQGLLRKLMGSTPIRQGKCPCVWFHAVSVGEVLLLRQVIARFRQRHPDWECVLSTTTNTGFEVAQKHFGDLTIFYWPLDFSWAVRRALKRIRPDLVVLAELELWPNFVAEAKRQAVKLAVINGRMSSRSFRGYSRIRWLMKSLLRKIDLFAVQNDDYAERLIALGASPERVMVTGSVKYDGVNTDRQNPKTAELGELFGFTGDEIVWVVGSTQPPEEEIALDIYRRNHERLPQMRLILVPRHKERFEEVAAQLERSGLPFVRRSWLIHPLTPSPPHPLILVDTLGELAAVWGLADVAFVGGSLHPRGGQNMIEPAAYGAAVTFGPHVWNFQDTVDRLLECRGAIQIQNAGELERVTVEFLQDAEKRQALGVAARDFVLSQQGATARTLNLLEPLLEAPASAAQAA